MERKLTKAEFCRLAQKREGIKRTRKAMQEWQEKRDEWAVENERRGRIYKKARIVI
jgi:hypothetical protein